MDEEKIIKGIKKKNHKALRAFIDSYGGILKAAIYKTLPYRSELREEALDDALLAVWENIDSFDKRRSSFKNWCAGIAKYKAIDILRKELRHRSSDFDDYENTLAYEDDYDLGEVELILSRLSEDDRKIFTKLFLEGYSYDELSNAYDISKAGLYNRVSRARNKLKKDLGD